jgi:hypothetical protein
MPAPFAHAGAMAARLDLTTTTIAIGAISLFAAACSPSTAAELSTAPRVDDLQVVVSGADAIVVAEVGDDNGDLASIVIEWGDGVEQTVESGFPGLRVDHAYTVPGSYTLIVQALDEAGNSAIETADVEIDEIDDVAAPSTTEQTATTTTTVALPTTTTPPTTAPTAPPTTAPAPPPPTAPTTTMPPPGPISMGLIDTNLVFAGRESADDGAGGSAQLARRGLAGVELHAEALAGYNGSGSASATYTRGLQTAGLFDDPRVTEILVTVDYSITALGQLRAPFDRRATFTLDATLGTEAERLLRIDHATDDVPGSAPELLVDRRFADRSLAVTVRPGDVVPFDMYVRCTASSGGQALALAEHGWCDFLGDGRRVELTELAVVFTPILG